MLMWIKVKNVISFLMDGIHNPEGTRIYIACISIPSQLHSGAVEAYLPKKRQGFCRFCLQLFFSYELQTVSGESGLDIVWACPLTHVAHYRRLCLSCAFLPNGNTLWFWRGLDPGYIVQRERYDLVIRLVHNLIM